MLLRNVTIFQHWLTYPSPLKRKHTAEKRIVNVIDTTNLIANIEINLFMRY